MLFFTKRVSLATVWGAVDQSNQLVVYRTLGSFVCGMRKGVVQRIVMPNTDKKAVLDWAKEKEISTGGASDVAEHVQSFAYSSISFKTNNKRGNRKKWGAKREKKSGRTTAKTILCIRFFLQRILQQIQWVVQLFFYFLLGLEL